MKRITIPPTKFDPMRPVQAKMAAPTSGPGVRIPLTRFAPVSGYVVPQGLIQRAAAAAGSGAGATGGANPPPHVAQAVERHRQPDINDTWAMAFARSKGLGELHLRNVSDIVAIGTDWQIQEDPNEQGAALAAWLAANWLRPIGRVQCLAIQLVISGGGWSKAINKAWLEARIRSRKHFRLITGSKKIWGTLDGLEKERRNGRLPAAPAIVSRTTEELLLLYARGYRLNFNRTLLIPPPRVVVVAQGGAAPAALGGAAAAAGNAAAAVAKPQPSQVK